MKRLELYISNDGKLVLSVFDPVDSEYEKYILRGAEVYRYIRKLENQKIIDIEEDPNDINATLIYKNYVLNLNEYEKILNRRGLNPIIDGLKKYIEREKLKRIKGKKVTRKKKFNGKVMVATSLTVIILGTCASKLIKPNNLNDYQDNNTSITQSTYIDEENYNDEEIIHIELNQSDEKTEDDHVLDNIIEKDDDGITSITVNYDDRSSTAKANKTQEYYGDLISKYATMYGIDPSLALAIATQERGVHSSVMDTGGATGLMQIQNSVWIGQKVQAYNFNTKQVESFIVTEDKLKDLEYNIKIGCMILQNSFEYMKYNTLAAIQCYNMGYGNMLKIIKEYGTDTNKTVDEILSNIEDDEWLSYRELITQGDQKYIEHVVSWMGEDVNIKNVKKDGTLVSVNINSNFNSKKVY